MSATTLADVVDAVRAVVVEQGYHETVVPFGFDLTPSSAIDQAARVVTGSVRVTGQIGVWEEQTAQVEVWLATRHGQDVTASMQQMRRDGQALVAALVQASLASGTWDIVEDGGRTLDVAQDPGRSYTVGRVAVPITYEVEL